MQYLYVGWEDESTQCRTLSNDCLNHTCLNGATCLDDIRAYFCLCLPGYTGKHRHPLRRHIIIIIAIVRSVVVKGLRLKDEDKDEDLKIGPRGSSRTRTFLEYNTPGLK